MRVVCFVKSRLSDKIFVTVLGALSTFEFKTDKEIREWSQSVIWGWMIL